MKKTLVLRIFVIIILLITGLVFFIYKNRSINNEPPNKTLKTTSPSSYTFNIEVQGNKILVNKNPFVFQGVTSNYFRYPHGGTYFDKPNELIFSVDEVRGWGANTLQLYLNPDLFDNNYKESNIYLNELDQIINWCLKNNIWVILNPVNDVPWESGVAIRTKEGLLKRDNITLFLDTIAKSSSRYPNVIFGIETEPKFIDDPAMINERMGAIKKYNKNPIIIPVVNFSGTFDVVGLINKGLDIKDIILDIHPYPSSNLDTQTAKVIKLNKFIDQNIYDRYPIIFGEFGGFWERDFNTPEDVSEMKQVGELAKSNNISFIAYALDDYLIPLFDKDGNINNRGLAVKELLLP